MNEEPLQKGGVDPGLAALIAALLTGSVGSYGYLNDKDSPEAKAKMALQTQIDSAKNSIARASSLEIAKQALESTLKARETELATLKTQLEALKKTASSKSELEDIFKNATSEVLTRAVEPTLEKLKDQYPSVNIDGELRKALQYPGSYQGRLMRMSLYDFYYKRVKPAFEKDRKVGRKGRTSGESEPSTPSSLPPVPESPYPDFDTFAKMYTDVILSSISTLEEVKKTESDVKKDQIAINSAKTLADKLQKVIADAEKEIPTYHSMVGKNEELMSRETALYADLENAKTQIEQPLRLVKTEGEWNTKKNEAKRILEEIPQKVKSYAKAVKEAPKTTTEPVILPEPSIEEVTTVQNPLVLKQELERQKKVIEEQKAKLASEGPIRLTRRNTRKSFGGKARKRTLKKRRGGK